jgi:hypothetical protein
MTEAMKALSPPSQEAPLDERESPQTVEEEPERARAPPRYRRASGGCTEALVEEVVRWLIQFGHARRSLVPFAKGCQPIRSMRAKRIVCSISPVWTKTWLGLRKL